MDNWGSSSVYAIIIILGILLVSVVAADLINGTATTTIEQDLTQMTNEAIEKYSSYLDVDFKVGKFFQVDGRQKIKRIALHISPLFTTDIDLIQCTVQLLNNEIIELLNYSGFAKYYNGGNLFENQIWNNITEANFGILVINDRDDSVVNHSLINENSDRVYLIFKLSDDIALLKYDKLYVTIFPGTGLIKSIILKAPMPIKSVVIFD